MANIHIIKPSVVLIDPPDRNAVYERIEAAGRTCYQSQDKTAPGSAAPFIAKRIAAGHESILEHVSLSARFICSRGAGNEIVRHRIASYSQESTRYCRYDHELTVIEPSHDMSAAASAAWTDAMMEATRAYEALIAAGENAEIARDVLPLATKTELVMTANIREWRHFILLRASKAAHPELRFLATALLKDLLERYPVLFEDIKPFVYGLTVPELICTMPIRKSETP